MADRPEISPFRLELQTRFVGTYTISGGEVWVRYEDAVAAIDLAQERGLRVLGMEGFVVGGNVYPCMSRIADFSLSGDRGNAYQYARALLIGPWATVLDVLRSDANGTYMIDVAVERS